jgi:hypothetical protein
MGVGMTRPDPVELIAVAIPVLIEVVAVVLMFAAAFVWLAIWSGA